MRRTLTAAAVTVVLLSAACGGGGTKNATGGEQPSASNETTTSTTAVSETTTTAVAGTPTTAAVTGGGVTSTTAKKTAAKSTATTAKKTQLGNTGLRGGITNVTAAPTTTPPSDLQVGGTITLLKATDTLGFDPILATASSGADGPTNTAVYGQLVYADPADGQVKPWMADSLTSTDAVVWTLKVHPNIKFTDGTPYDAAAVKFNWERLQDPKNSANRAAQANTIASMEVVDALTLKLTLKTKNAVFSQSVATIPFIASPTAIRAKGSAYNNDPVGAGPFVIKSWTRDSQIVFERNPSYWDFPRPYIDQLVMKIIGDETQRLNTMQASGGDIMWTVTTQSAEALRKANFVEFANVQNGGPNIYFNVRAGKQFADKRARMAVTLGIDRCDLVKTVLNNVVGCSDSIFRPNSPYYDSSILQPAYNPTEAQNLFNQLAAENGGTYNIKFTSFQYGNFPAEATYIQSKLNGFKNVKVDLIFQATNLHITKTLSGDFDMTSFSNPFDDPEPTWTGVFLCTNPSSPTGWCNTSFDQAVDRGKLTLDPNERARAMKDAQRAFYADVPGFYFERRVTWHYGTSAIQDLRMVGDGTILVDRIWKKR